jgi:hypothetical protein
VKRFEKFSVCPPPMRELLDPPGHAGECRPRVDAFVTHPFMHRGFGGAYVGSLAPNENAVRMVGKWDVPHKHLRRVWRRWLFESVAAVNGRTGAELSK